ncbi:MAG: YggS family pyridoxal phosphate-dependent enzyme [Rickettsiaceae bacterium]|jgi:pyridoxal phosphate enzyme (YggS family)|nr:YggS family pyridoxal phosphate-dependent enzyme [Rickettsiaceae bacterium]
MSIAKNIASVRQIIKNSGREINLVAVSKNIGEEKIKQAIDCGCLIFGENKVMEAKAKWTSLKQQYPDIKLHLIGHLQSNKVKDAVEIFDVIQVLDSEKLAELLAKEMAKQNKFPEIFVQINIGEEEQKSGIKPAEAKEFIQKITNNYNLQIAGVMAIPPVGVSPALYFALLTKIARENNLQNISMGMSNDFEVAINLGANFIRVGTAIFGER